MINPHTHTYTHTKTEVAPGYDDVFVQYQAHERGSREGPLDLQDYLKNYWTTYLPYY